MRVAAAQMEVTLDLETNVQKIKQFIEAAGRIGIKALNFPEMALTGYDASVLYPENRQPVERALEDLGELALQSDMFLVVGAPVWADGTIYNSGVVLGPSGRRQDVYKRHLVAGEESWFSAGAASEPFVLEQWRAGVMVCRDQNFPYLAAQLKDQGAQILFQCCAHYYVPMEARWKIDKNVALPLARATENQIWLVKANCVGSVRGKVSLGNSLIAGPNGVLVGRAGETEETLLSFDLDPGDTAWNW